MSDDHLSLDELAELAEGLLPTERSSAIRAHLDGCTSCQSRADAITATQSMLGDLPPLTMPDDVKNRIDAVLAAELAVHEGNPPATEESAAPVTDPIDPDTRSSDVIPDVVSLPRRRIGRPSAAASAAAAAIVLAVGAIIVGHSHHKSTPDTADVAGGTGASSSTSSQNPLNFDLHNDILVTRTTGAHYTASDLTALTSSLLGSVGAAATPSAASSSTADPTSKKLAETPSAGFGASAQSNVAKVPHALLPLLHSKKKLTQCASTQALTPGALPVVVDFGHWTAVDGTTNPAAVLVFKTNSLDTYRVYVVKATCATQPGGALLSYQEVTVQ